MNSETSENTLCSVEPSVNMFVPLYSSEVFCGRNNDVLKENETIKFPKLAQTYRKIAEEGAGAFYEGDVARNLVADIQSAGSVAQARNHVC